MNSHVSARNGAKKPRGKPFTGKDDPRRNNEGRPVSQVSVTSILRKLAEESRGKVDPRARAQALAEKIWDSALEGNDRMIAYLVDRLDGKAMETVNLGETEDASKLIAAAALARRQVAYIRKNAPQLLPGLLKTVGIE